MNRRHWIYLGGGAAALAAGAASRLHGLATTKPPGGAVDAFWQAPLTSPDGTPLALAPLRGKPLVLNFWATWCPPCVKEMPEIDRYARGFAARGGVVVGVAVDNAKPVREFLATRPVSYTIAVAGFAGAEIARKLGNTAGALPYTVVISAAGAVTHQRLGPTSFDELERWTHDI
ncbi:MAG: TlpA family protein disulfide reductase [Burkholderiales bacterium]|nr:TlpA family protein disulfide reductase [Burkholderiales bacterium]MDE1928764.1 TlpA family protein disulfide reductase [Burkholderiales bacterium]MDE2159954.1 TlpA family protein disulfide reductase [Burkholderiales bacterium]